MAEKDNNVLPEVFPELMEAFGSVKEVALVKGEIGAKEKEFIALGISVAVQCEKCITAHMEALIELGATRREIAEVVGVNVLMGGGPATVYGTKALEAYDELSKE